MANYYNPYNFYQQPTYPQTTQIAPQVPQYTGGSYLGQTSYAAAPQVKAMEWVEGEIGAKAFQIPAGWPANSPIALWDSTDTVIYLKSINQNGIPNPLQKLHYTIEEQPNPLLMSGATQNSQQSMQQSGVDMSNYVTKEDFETLRKEISLINEAYVQKNQNRNNNNNGNNRG